MKNIIVIHDLNQKELEPYVSQNENQLLNRANPEEGIFIAESPKVIIRALDAGYEPLSLLVETKQIEGEAKDVVDRLVSFKADIPIFTADDSLLCKLTGFHLTRGALCAMRRKTLSNVEDFFTGSNPAKKIVILENVVNPTNVGAIIRSAAALGMDAVILTKGCSNPLYRRAIRVSMGTVFQIPWTILEEEEWPNDLLLKLKEQGYLTLSMALKEDSIRLDDKIIEASDKTVVVMGTEGEGLSSETIALTDHTVYIPMYHEVDSLNVAAASAVAFYALGNTSNCLSDCK